MPSMAPPTVHPHLPECTPDNALTPTTPPLRPKFPRDEAGFYAELRRRIGAYFATGRSERDCWQMYLKTAIIFAWLAVTYSLLVFAVETWWQAIPVALGLALGIATVGLAIQHDGGHHAYSRREWINKLAAMSLDVIGASSYLWRWKHVVMHHTYPNVDGEDMDLEAGAVARLSPHQPRRWYHRWQHLYLWPLYALTSSRWHLYGDFKEVVVGKIGPHRIPRPRGWDLVVFLAGKAFSIGLLLVVPMFFHDWWVVLLYYFLATGATGVMLTVVFQLAHCVGEAEFPVPVAGTPRMPDAWAAHQVRTTVDFARRSPTLSWLVGGLNFQVVHHLFPQICHVHYPALSRIVESTCQEFGIPYATHGSFLAGIRAHYRWLQRLGQPDEPQAAQA